MIIGIYSSLPRMGKTVVKDVFIQNGFTPLSFATPVKNTLFAFLIESGIQPEQAKEYLWGSAKSEIIEQLGISSGELMASFATKYGRGYLGDDVWLNIARLKVLANPTKNYVIDDLRFQNEFAWIKSSNGLTIRVDRPAIKSTDRKFAEGLLDTFAFDYVLQNNTTLDNLRQSATNLLLGLTNWQKT